MIAVRVPPGATCRLLGTTVLGDVLVGPQARLIARRMAVSGDVIGHGARRVLVTSRSVIGGSVVLAHGGSGAISTAQIHGDLRWFMQTGLGTVRQTVIGDDLVAGRSIGRLIVTANRIGGDMQCRQNLRVPMRVTNFVAGRRLGQCASAPLPGTERWSGSHRDHDRPVTTPRWRPPCAGDSVSDDPSDDACDED